MFNLRNIRDPGIAMSFYRAGVLGLALLTIVQGAEANAQMLPVIGYVAAKNAEPKRLEVFKKGLAEFGYFEEKNIRIEYRESVLTQNTMT